MSHLCLDKTHKIKYLFDFFMYLKLYSFILRLFYSWEIELNKFWFKIIYQLQVNYILNILVMLNESLSITLKDTKLYKNNSYNINYENANIPYVIVYKTISYIVRPMNIPNTSKNFSCHRLPKMINFSCHQTWLIFPVTGHQKWLIFNLFKKLPERP